MLYLKLINGQPASNSLPLLSLNFLFPVNCWLLMIMHRPLGLLLIGYSGKDSCWMSLIWLGSKLPSPLRPSTTMVNKARSSCASSKVLNSYVAPYCYTTSVYHTRLVRFSAEVFSVLGCGLVGLCHEKCLVRGWVWDIRWTLSGTCWDHAEEA